MDNSKNDRIEAIISEEIWNLAHEQVQFRLMHGNTDGNLEKRDTTNKIICNCCGKNFYICYSKKIDAFIDDLTKNYYKNIKLSNKAKLYKLQSELKALRSKSVIDINNECESIKAENI